MKDVILTLDEIGSGDGERVGLAAADMAALRRAGLPVPDAFCLTSGAYLAAAEELNLAERERELAARETGIEAELAEIRKLIREFGVGPKLEAALDGAAAALGSGLLTVSLSPVVASYDAAAIAGLAWAAEYLPSDAVREAVPECWASLWRPRPVTFRKRVGLEPGKTAAAVLVAAADPAPLAGRIKPADGEAEAWLIDADPRVRGRRDLTGAPAEKGKPQSPLTPGQAEALKILADGAAEALGEPRKLGWSFDGRRFAITGFPYG